MAIKNIEINYYNGSSYDILLPKILNQIKFTAGSYTGTGVDTDSSMKRSIKIILTPPSTIKYRELMLIFFLDYYMASIAYNINFQNDDTISLVSPLSFNESTGSASWSGVIGIEGRIRKGSSLFNYYLISIYYLFTNTSTDANIKQNLITLYNYSNKVYKYYFLTIE